MQNQKLRRECVHRNTPILLFKKLLAEWKKQFVTPPPKKRPKMGMLITFFQIVELKIVFGEIVALNTVYLALKFWPT